MKDKNLRVHQNDNSKANAPKDAHSHLHAEALEHVYPKVSASSSHEERGNERRRYG